MKEHSDAFVEPEGATQPARVREIAEQVARSRSHASNCPWINEQGDCNCAPVAGDAPQIPPPPDQLRDPRKELWLHHGHFGPALYGDDGEMQCKSCEVWDYRRAPFAVIALQAAKSLRSALAAERQRTLELEGVLRKLERLVVELYPGHVEPDAEHLGEYQAVWRAVQDAREALSRPASTGEETSNG
jgi:hypothetical protein